MTLVISAVCQDGMVLQYVNEDFRNDEIVVMSACENNPLAF
jgi:hypothetical protein